MENSRLPIKVEEPMPFVNATDIAWKGLRLVQEKFAIPLPSVLTNSTFNRGMYGGDGDKVHLGGFTDLDGDGVSTGAWREMMEFVGVKSVLDVGCGKGVSTTFFLTQGLDALCVEGSHDAVTHTLLSNPQSQLVEHDFSRGPWWPSTTYDAIWAVEFLEHVGRNYHRNLFPALKKAALVFATHSNWGGWHHVEVHSDEWWITKFQMNGFIYSEYLTTTIRRAAKKTAHQTLPNTTYALTGQHIWLSLMVFINPEVASLPEHDHLMAEHGCYKAKKVNRKCDEKKRESVLPSSYSPVKFKEDKFLDWQDMIIKELNLETNENMNPNL